MQPLPLPNLEPLSKFEDLTARLGLGQVDVTKITSKYVKNKGTAESWIGSHETQYDPDATYTRATNEFDHSVTVRVPFPREVMSLVQRIVHSGIDPAFRSRNDYIRNAVVHQLHRDAARIANAEPVLHLERVLCLVDQLEAATATMDRLVDRVSALGDQFIRAKAWGPLGDLVWTTELIADSSPEPWSTKLNTLRLKWATLIDGLGVDLETERARWRSIQQDRNGTETTESWLEADELE